MGKSAKAKVADAAKHRARYAVKAQNPDMRA